MNSLQSFVITLTLCLFCLHWALGWAALLKRPVSISMSVGGDASMPRFKADHPFAFMLAKRKSQILFNGVFDV
jgi:hypothetical protein